MTDRTNTCPTETPVLAEYELEVRVDEPAGFASALVVIRDVDGIVGATSFDLCMN